MPNDGHTNPKSSKFDVIKLAFKSIKSDLLDLSKIQWLIIIFLVSLSCITAVIDLNYFFGKVPTILIWTNNELAGKSLFKNIMIVINGIGTSLAVFGLILSLNGKVSNFLWNISSSIIYCVFCFGYGYIGGFQMELCFLLPMRIIGIFSWTNNLDKQKTAIVKRLSLTKWMLVLLLISCLFVFLFFEIAFVAKIFLGAYYFENNLLARCMEALASSIAVTVHILATNRYLEQWILRLLNSTNQIILFSGTVGLDLNSNAILMWTIIICVSISALITWLKRMKLQQSDFYRDIESGTALEDIKVNTSSEQSID